HGFPRSPTDRVRFRIDSVKALRASVHCAGQRLCPRISAERTQHRPKLQVVDDTEEVRCAPAARFLEPANSSIHVAELRSRDRERVDLYVLLLGTAFPRFQDGQSLRPAAACRKEACDAAIRPRTAAR